MKKGNLTIEVAVVFTLVILIFCAFFLHFNKEAGMILSSSLVVEEYEEAFYKKLDAFFLEKVHREWR